ncbi:MAG: hypothetical protein ACYDBH_24410 [Acidobacteriaceae bacterium]
MIRKFGIAPLEIGEHLERFAAPRRLGYLVALILACFAGAGLGLLAFDALKLMGAI